MNNLAIGIDIGASKILGIVWDGNKIAGRYEHKYRGRPRTAKEFWQVLFEVIDALFEKFPKKYIMGIGLGFPGAIENGHKIWSPGNLAAIKGLEALAPLKKRYRTKIVVTNDAHAAAFGEYKLGAGKNTGSMLMLTLGSGTGCGFVKDGELQNGAFDTAFEVSRMTLEATKTLKSGKWVELEDFASEKFFKNRGTTPRIAAELARKGNKKAKKLWEEFGRYLGIILVNFIVSLEPEVIALGGGKADAWPLFAPVMLKIVRKFTPSPLALRKTKIVRAKLGRDAGAIGAALLVQSKSA